VSYSPNVVLLRIAIPLILAGCGAGAVAPAGTAALRPGCGADQRWNGAACKPVGDARSRVETAAKELAAFHVPEATAALAGVEDHGPLDHDTHVKLWEQRGIAAAYAEDPAAATRAFDMLLALDPPHLLSYTLSPQATFVFERSRVAAGAPPSLDISWAQGQKLGAPVPLEVEVIADPKDFLVRATVFVRRRGDSSWQAADVALGAPGTRTRVILPAFTGTAATALELYARAYDDRDNEVLAWSDATRPREIPLRYDPPTPWHRKWWVWAAVGGVVAAGAAIGVYAATREPPTDLPPIGVSRTAR
jgi:hypothetical protein